MQGHYEHNEANDHYVKFSMRRALRGSFVGVVTEAFVNKKIKCTEFLITFLTSKILAFD